MGDGSAGIDDQAQLASTCLAAGDVVSAYLHLTTSAGTDSPSGSDSAQNILSLSEVLLRLKKYRAAIETSSYVALEIGFTDLDEKTKAKASVIAQRALAKLDQEAKVPTPAKARLGEQAASSADADVDFPKDLIGSDFVDSRICLRQSEQRGLYVTAKVPISAGTVLMRASGFPTIPHLPDFFSRLLCSMKLMFSPSRRATFQYLHPRFLSDVDESQLLERERPMLQCDGTLMAPMIYLYFRQKFNAFADGIFPLASVFNHSCFANCVFRRRGSQLEIRAIANVPAGAELTLPYFGHVVWTRSRRSTHLASAYGFRCNCVRCTGIAPGFAVDRCLEAVRCPALRCGGYLYPSDKVPQCPTCRTRVDWDDVQQRVDALTHHFRAAARAAGRSALYWRSAVSGLQAFLEDAKRVLHPLHVLNYEAYMRLAHLCRALIENGTSEKSFPGLRDLVITYSTGALDICDAVLPANSMAIAEHHVDLAFAYTAKAGSTACDKPKTSTSLSASSSTAEDLSQQAKMHAVMSRRIYGVHSEKASSGRVTMRMTKLDVVVAVLLVVGAYLVWDGARIWTGAALIATTVSMLVMGSGGAPTRLPL